MTWNSQTPFLWATKSTKVTTTDKISGLAYVTTYSYTPWNVPVPPNETSCFYGQLPVEDVVKYKDSSGSVLRTVSKGWTGSWADLLTSEQVALENNLTKKMTYSYAGFGQLGQKQEFAYGSGAPGALVRNTVIDYANFSPQFIYDRTVDMKTYDGAGCLVAETDYTYDGTDVTPTSGLPGHDYTNYGSSFNVRGNATERPSDSLRTAQPRVR